MESLHTVPETKQEKKQAKRSVAAFAKPLKNIHKLGIREGMTVADFGAGPGFYTLASAHVVGESGHVYAIDVQKDLLVRLKNEATEIGYENVKVVWGDIEMREGTKLPDEAVDVVIFSNTLFQVDGKDDALTEAWRVLKKSGKLALIDWSESFKGIGPPVDRLVTKEQAKGLAQHAHFSFDAEFDAGAHHYGLLFSKQ